MSHTREPLSRTSTRAVLGSRDPGGATRAAPVVGSMAHLLTAGNHATARALSSRKPALRNGGVLQRANLKWSPDDTPTIVGIDFGPRTGAQEDHTTAVAAFKLAVVQNLRGCTLQQAVIQLLILANEMTELPGFGDYRNQYLQNQVDTLKGSLTNLIEIAETKQLYVAGELGALIDSYLRIRNLVPGTKFEKSGAIRPTGYKGGGAAEKEGKSKLIEVLAALGKNKAEPFANIEQLVTSALQLLHDYIATRKTPPSAPELVKIAAQHFHSLMQVSTLLYPFARQILDVWVNYMVAQWSSQSIDRAGFGAAVEMACAVYFPGPEQKHEPAKREEVWGKNKDGYFPLGWDELTVELAGSDKEDVNYRRHRFSRWEQDRTISLLNRAAEQGLIAAARAIEYFIEHPDEQDEILRECAWEFIELPSGKIFIRLRGG
jgi:hypothetical protein